MKQTNQYRFNLIEATDSFSPDPLNENAQIMETQLAVLSGVLSGCGNAKIAGGSYEGSGGYGAQSPNTLSFDFVPRLVIVTGGSQTMVAVCGSSHAAVFSGSKKVSNFTDSFFNWYVETTWDGNTLSWWAEDGTAQLNKAQTYYYVALG